MILDRRVHKVTVFVIKILPSIGCLFMWTHSVTLLLGKDWIFAESGFGLSVASAMMLMLFSLEYRFPIIHQLQILYIIAMQFCITFQRVYGFGEFLTMARIVMLLLGGLLILKVCLNFKEYVLSEPHRYMAKKPRSEAQILQDIYDSLNSHKAFERRNMEHEGQIKHSIAMALKDTGVIDQLNELRERMDEIEDEEFSAKKRSNCKKNVLRVYRNNIKEVVEE